MKNKIVFLMFILSMLLYSGNASANLTDGLIYNYNFNTNYDDSTENYNGVNSGGAIDNINYLLGGGSFSTSATSQHLTIPYEPQAISPINTNYTVNFWFKSNDTNNGYLYVFGSVDDDTFESGTLLNILRVSSEVRFIFSSWDEGRFGAELEPWDVSATIVVPFSTYNIFDNEWHMVSVTMSEDSVKVYYDSLLQNTTLIDEWVGWFIKDSSPATVYYHGLNGKSGSRPGSIGKYDELSLWINNSLSQSELETLYNSGTGLAYPFSGGGNPACDETLSQTCDVTGAYIYNNTNVEVDFNYTFAGETVNPTDIIVGSNSIFINSSSLLNQPATITFKNVDNPVNKFIYKDGELCTLNCSNIIKAVSTIEFYVTGFSNYSYENNTAPNITSYQPTNLTPTIFDNENLQFNITASDAENQTLSYEWYVNGTPQSSNATTFLANGSLLGVGSYNIIAVVNDSLLTDSQEWSLTVEEYIPYAPQIDSFTPTSPAQVMNVSTQVFTVTASDNNSDSLTYAWYVNGSVQGSTTNSFSFNANLYGNGEWNVTVVVSDGMFNVSQEWDLTVLGVINTYYEKVPNPSSYSTIGFSMDAGYEISVSEWSTVLGVLKMQAYGGSGVNSNSPNCNRVLLRNGTSPYTILAQGFDREGNMLYFDEPQILIPDEKYIISCDNNGASYARVFVTSTGGFPHTFTDRITYHRTFLGITNPLTTSFVNNLRGVYLEDAEVQFAPNIDSFSPVDTTPNIYNNQNQLFSVTVSDANFDTLTYEWYINGTPQSHNSNSFTAQGSVLGVGLFNITTTITDGLYTVSQEWTLNITLAPPAISSVTISPTILTEQSTPIGSCTATGITNLDFSYIWYQNGVNVANGTELNLTSGTTLTNAYGVPLVEGHNWTFSCYVIDDNLQTAGYTNSSTKQVQPNSPPSVTPTIDTPVYDVDDSLNARCLVTDANGDNSTLYWQLYKNNVVQVQGTENNVVTGTNVLLQTVTDEQLFIGDEWIISCNATDGYDASGWVNSSTATILEDARPPVISIISIGPSIILTNYTNITAGGSATDPNGGTIYMNFTLYKNSVSVELINTTISSGGTANIIFNYSDFTGGDLMKVGLYAYDSGGKNDTENSSIITARNTNSPPAIESLRTVPASFIDTSNNIQGYCKAVDIESDAVKYNYIWYRNGVNIKSGQTASFVAQNVERLVDTLSASSTNVGDTIIFSCGVTDLLNASGYTNATSQLIYSVGNVAPVMRSVNIVPTGTQGTDVDFNVTLNATDDNADNLIYEWRFVKNGAFQTVFTTTSYPQGVQQLVGILNHTQTTANDNWYVRARAFDGSLYSNWAVSNTINIANTVPVMTSSIISSTPLENTTLISLCTATDADGQNINFEYRWYKDNVLTATSEDISSILTTADEEWILSCRGTDGIGYSSWLNSTPVTIIDTVTAPTMGSVTVAGLNTAGGFTGTCVANDIEGDLLNYTILFYKNNVLQQTNTSVNQVTGTTQTFTINPTVTVEDSWKVGCVATDLDGSIAQNSTVLTVPAINFYHYVETITPTSILINWETNADTVEVYRNNVLRADTTLLSHLSEGLIPETTYNYTLIPKKNGFRDVSRIFNVTTIQSDNNPPIMQATTINPGTIYTNSSVSGTCRASDIDNIKVFYTYEWRINNALITSGVTSLHDQNVAVSIGGLSNTLFESGDNISLSCIASDGVFSSNTLLQNKTVGNLVPTLENLLVEVNETFYQTSYDYEDIDGDEINNISYKWFKNNVLVSTASTYLINNTDINDIIFFELNVENDYHTLIQNSSEFIVGDFIAPTLEILVYPTDVFTDSAAEYLVRCVDSQSGVALDYPIVTMLNPNNQLETTKLFYVGDDEYTRFKLFSIAGEYKEVEITCQDGNSNSKTIQLNEIVTSLVRETTINIGGSGSSPGGDGPRISFDVNPEIETIVLAPGSTSLEEFEVINTGEIDLRFTSAILRTDDFDTFDWITFDNGGKTAIFDINLVGGLSGNNRFIRYQVSIPDDVEDGTYVGLIEINGQDVTESLQLEIIVDSDAGITFFDFINIPLFSIPGTGTPTGNVVAGEAEITGVTVVTVGGLLLVLLGVVGFVAGYIYLRRRVK